MDKTDITIVSVDKNKVFQHPALDQKGLRMIADVKLIYKSLSINCSLVKGYNKNEGLDTDPFYFLELPCYRYRDKKNIWRKINYLNFENKDECKEFQDLSFGIIFENFPALFQDELKTYKQKIIAPLPSKNIEATKKTKTAKIKKKVSNE